MKKDFLNLRRSRWLLLTLFALLVGASPAGAVIDNGNGTVTEGFDDASKVYSSGWILTLPSGWDYSGDPATWSVENSKDGIYKTKPSLYAFSTSNSSNYLITPELDGEFSFWMRSYNTSYGSSVAAYECTYEGGVLSLGEKIGEVTIAKAKPVAAISKQTINYSGNGRIALLINYAYFDDFTYTPYVDNGAIAKPTNFACTTTTYNSATLGWTAGGEETAWQMVYSTDAGFDKDAATPIDITTNPYTLTGLSESTTYYAYLRAKSGEDVSSWTSKISFTTPVQYPAPTALASSGETTSAATLSWTAGSSETSWEISYSVNSDFSESTDVNVSTTPSKELTGLTANTTYYVKVRANYGEERFSAWTDAISFKTLQVATNASNYSDDFETSNNWNLINGTQNNAWAWGSAAQKDGSKGLYISNNGGTTNAYSGSSIVYASQLFSFAAGDYIVSYDWLCKGEKGSYGSASYDYLRVFLVPATTELTAGSGSFSYSGQPTGWISLDDAAALVNVSEWQHKSVNINIPSNANYYVVFAWISDGSGGDNPPAAIDNFSIRLNDTPNPTSLAVTDITAHAGTLGWTSTDNTWEVYYSTSSTTPAVDQTPSASPNTNSYTFTGLDAETKYYVWVRSVSKTNTSWKSDWVGTNFTTDIAAVAPTGLIASSITATGATLNWTAGADETKWDIVYGLYNDATDVRNTTEEITTTPTKVLTGLTSETTYYVFVRAKKGEEVSSWVSTSFFPTATVQLTVNEGDVTNQYVIEGYYGDYYQKTEYVIPSTDLVSLDGGIIKSMKLYISTAANKAFTSTFKVFLKEIGSTTIDSYQGYIDADVVYTGTLDAQGSTMDIVFDTDYEYNGGNLLVGIYNTTAGGNYTTSGTPKFNGTSSDGSMLYGRVSGSYSLNDVEPTQGNFLPKTTFTYLPLTGAKIQINKTAIDFGSVTTLPQNETFTISNSKGKADLTNIAVAITGADAAAYSVSALPRTTITTTGETAADIELTVTFNPAAGGEYNDATITINADDQDEKNIALSGTYVANPAMGVFNDSEATDAATTGETINFGYVQEVPTYTYYVKNTGAGTLDVAVENGGLTVSPANASLAAGAQQAFTITANVAEPDATVTFTGTNHDGGTAIGTFSVTLQGTVMPLASKFFEGFNYTDGNATTTELDGWEVNNNTYNVKYSGGKLCYDASSTETGNVVTPKLRVSGTSDVLRIYASITNKNWNNTKVAVYYSADKDNWIVARDLGKNDFDANNTLKNFEISGIPEGSYYFKIELSDAAVDYIYGFSTTHPAAVAMSESAAPSLDDDVVRDVTLTRSFAAGWNTVCLPFAVAAGDMVTKFGAGVKLYDFTGYNTETQELSFGQVDTGVAAGMPYIIYVTDAITDPISFFNANITETTAGTTTYNGATFQGTYAPIVDPNMDGKWGVTSEAKIAKGNASASMKGFRAYFEGITAGASARLSFIDEDGTTTVINALELNQNVEGVYNLQGQKVERMQKGLYIVNGRKVVRK